MSVNAYADIHADITMEYNGYLVQPDGQCEAGLSFYRSGRVLSMQLGFGFIEKITPGLTRVTVLVTISSPQFLFEIPTGILCLIKHILSI